MKKLILAALTSLLLPIAAMSQRNLEIDIVSSDLVLSKLSEGVWMHISHTEVEGYGRVSSNGLVVISKGNAILIDTPMTEELTKELVDHIEGEMEAKLRTVVPTHWHADCTGGLDYLHARGVKSEAYTLTQRLCAVNGLAMPQTGFGELNRVISNGEWLTYYHPGAGHTMDNIIVWLPKHKILFGGCLVKSLEAEDLGNTADGDLEAWPQSIRNVMEKFPEAEIVVPGHGQCGDVSLMHHTLELLSQAAQ